MSPERIGVDAASQSETSDKEAYDASRALLGVEHPDVAEEAREAVDALKAQQRDEELRKREEALLNEPSDEAGSDEDTEDTVH